MEEIYESKNLDHLGIVSGVCEEIGLVKLVDELLGTDIRESFSSGEIVKLGLAHK